MTPCTVRISTLAFASSVNWWRFDKCVRCRLVARARDDDPVPGHPLFYNTAPATSMRTVAAAAAAMVRFLTHTAGAQVKERAVIRPTTVLLPMLCVLENRGLPTASFAHVECCSRGQCSTVCFLLAYTRTADIEAFSCLPPLSEATDNSGWVLFLCSSSQ